MDRKYVLTALSYAILGMLLGIVVAATASIVLFIGLVLMAVLFIKTPAEAQAGK